MSTSYNEEDYQLLKRAGHDATKALEIAIDVKRSDPHAVAWIATLRRQEKEQKQ